MGFLKILTGKQRRISAAAATKSAALDIAFSADTTETVNPRRRSFLGIPRRSSSGTKTPSSPSSPVSAVPPCDLVYFTFRCSACKDRRNHCGANNEFKSGCHRAYARNASSPAATLSPRQVDKFTWPVEVKIYTIWVDFCGIGQWHNISETIKTHVGLWGDYDMDEGYGRGERLPTDLDRFLGVLEGKKVLAGVSMS